MASTSGWSHVLEQVKTWARANSPWVVHFNTGSCNGCDIEILAVLTPRYDLERFGVKLKGSPRHADVLICTGPVTRQARERLLQVYAQMHDPKFVVAVGSCALSGGAFRDCYNVMNGIDQVIPVNAYIPGCPPRPEAIIDGVVKLLQSLTRPERSELQASAVEGRLPAAPPAEAPSPESSWRGPEGAVAISSAAGLSPTMAGLSPGPGEEMATPPPAPLPSGTLRGRSGDLGPAARHDIGEEADGTRPAAMVSGGPHA